MGCISDEKYGDYVTPAEQAEIWRKQTIEVFINKDKDSVENLVNEKMRKKYNLDVEIQKFFEYIDGEIVLYGAILFFNKKGLCSEQLSSNPGHATKKLI